MSDKEKQTQDDADEKELEQDSDKIENTEPADDEPQAQAQQPQQAQAPAQAEVEEPEQAEPQASGPSLQQTAATTAAAAPLFASMNPNEDAMQRVAEIRAFGNDIHSGAIHPKTYSDLFADKSTLGKLGTIFGLIVGGAGAGLTHGPNMALEMMNKQIDRDIQAQQNSASNAQNWYQSALAHEKNKADIALTAAHTLGSQFGAVSSAAKAGQDLYNAHLAGAPIQAAAATYGHAAMAGLKHLQDMIDAQPMGLTKTNAQNILNNVITPAMFNEISRRQQDASGKAAIIKASMVPKEQAQQGPITDADDLTKGSPIDQDKYDRQLQQGAGGVTAYNPQAGVQPIAPGSPLDHDVKNEISFIRQNRANAGDYMKVANLLAQLPKGGQAPSAKLIDAIGSVLPGVKNVGGLGETAKNYFERTRQIAVKTLASRYGVSESDLDSILPGINDDKDNYGDIVNKGLDLFKNREAGLQNVRNQGLYKEFPKVDVDKVLKPNLQMALKKKKAQEEYQAGVEGRAPKKTSEADIGKNLFGGS